MSVTNYIQSHKIVFLAFFGLLYSCDTCLSAKALSGHGRFQDIPAPRYVVNLDLSPEERWSHILKNFDRLIIVNGIDAALSQLLKNSFVRDAALKVAAELDKFIPQPYSDELRGVSRALDIDLGKIVALNLFYEIVAYVNSPVGRACTSIVAMDKNNRIIHGRNMDFDFNGLLRNVTIDVEFKKGGKMVYIGTTFAGYIGMITATKPNVFSLSLNERNTGFWWENLVAALEESSPCILIMRGVLEKAQSYDEAVKILQSTRAIAPNYIIVGGMKPYEGAVLVGDRWGSIDVSTMNSSLEHRWFVVETNYDPWNQPPPGDDRRDAAIKSMLKTGQSLMDVASLLQVLSTPPVLNSDTVYTTVMAAYDSSIYKTVIRKRNANP